MNSTFSVVFLSDIKRAVLYCLELGYSNHGEHSFLSISEFVINSPCISLELVYSTKDSCEARDESVLSLSSEITRNLTDLLADDDSLVPLGGEASTDQKAHPHYTRWCKINAHIFTVQPTTLQSRKVSFKLPDWSSWGGEEGLKDLEESKVSRKVNGDVEHLLNDESPSNVQDTEQVTMMLRPNDFPTTPPENGEFHLESPDSFENSQASINGSVEKDASCEVLTPSMLGSRAKRDRSPTPSPDFSVRENSGISYPLDESRLRNMSNGLEAVLMEISAHMQQQSQMMGNFLVSLDEQKRNLEMVVNTQVQLSEKIYKMETAMQCECLSEVESVASSKVSSSRPVAEPAVNVISNRNVLKNVNELLKQMRVNQGEFTRRFNVIEQNMSSQKVMIDRLQTSVESNNLKPPILTPAGLSSQTNSDELATAVIGQFRPILQTEL
ncbi:hypothetical protein Ciccas_009088, partial [Cichlidogyrus casuarinus]